MRSGPLIPRLWLTMLAVVLGCCSPEPAGPRRGFIVEFQDGWLDYDYLLVTLEDFRVESLEEGCDDRWPLFVEAEAEKSRVSSELAASGVGALPFAAKVNSWTVNARGDIAVGCDDVGSTELVEVLLRKDGGWSAVPLPTREGHALKAPLAFRPGYDQVLLGVTTRSLKRLTGIFGLVLVDTMTGESSRSGSLIRGSWRSSLRGVASRPWCSPTTAGFSPCCAARRA